MPTPVITTAAGKSILLDGRLGMGGEGEVWVVHGSREVAKLYHPAVIKPELEQKLKTMVANPPEDEMRLQGHISIAWPTDLLYRSGQFAGFLMPRLEKTPTIFTVYNPVRRQKECPGFNWKYLLHTAVNLSKAIDAIHLKGYVIGDLNESNVLVNAMALVSVIDTDSFQVKGPHGQLYRCKVGKEDFTPPELQDISLDKVERLPEHDYFGLGVLIFRLLMEGLYPYAGVLKDDLAITEPSQFYCLKQGAFPYKPNVLVTPPPSAPKFEMLPRDVQHLMVRCFVTGHKNPKARPAPREWIAALEAAENSLKVCKVNPAHYYSGHLVQCPWCERESRNKANLQIPLPPASASRPLPSKVVSSSPLPTPTSTYRPSQPSSRPTAPAYIPTRSPSSIPTAPRSPYWPSLKTNRPPESLWQRVKKFFRSPGGSLRWRTWWRETLKPMQFGAYIGIGLSLLILLMFWYPVAAGYACGVIAAGLILVITFFVARFLYGLVFSQGHGMGILAFLLGAALAAIAGFQVAGWAGATLSTTSPVAGLILLDGVLVGAIGGLSYGNYRTLTKFKSKALAFASSLALGGVPLFLIWAVGLFNLPFQH